MGKSLTRDQRKNSKYIKWDEARKEKERIQYEAPTDSEKPKIKQKKVYRSHNDSYDD